MKDIFLEEATKNGWDILDTFAHSKEDLDYRTVLLKIKQLNPDAVYIPFAAEVPNKGEFMKQMRELGIQLPIVSTSSTESSPLLENYGIAVEGIIYPYPAQTPKYTEFIEKFKQRYRYNPDSPSAATAYDAMHLLVEALKSGAQTPQEAANYLHSLKDYSGVSNVITFDKDGIVSDKEHIIKTVKNKQFSLVDL